MLEVDGLSTRYGAIAALRGADLRVGTGEVVALIGPNGAGKTTLLNTIGGVLRPAAGTVRVNGLDVTRSTPEAMVRHGVALVPEHRRLFRDLTVEENLLLGGVVVKAADRRRRLEELIHQFPILGVKRHVQAGFLSGGEGQQLAMARALMSDPRLLLMDEPALGLAPVLVDVLMRLISELRAGGRTILIVEQNVAKVLEVADRAYVMRTGTIVEEGTAADLRTRTDLFAAYLGVA
ncbi:MAG TPA: ABC transporter ATP-binding protein [Acidimicrobiales bacterium]|nr:ABC transporter ATP-binding protein [Acidimicrobiales bacterium]